ncbi:MAG: elongation factor G [Deltaproteobacteria bacterium]|nr:elongation factor G [Deltaproteobacteria bacterium]
MNKKRVIAIVGGRGSGKTTLAEDILFLTKKINRKGSIDNGNTTMDFDSEEIQRKLSLQLAVGYTDWEKHHLSIIDTPGYGDFIGEAFCGAKVADGALLVIDAIDGMKAETNKLFKQLTEEKKPVFVIINILDKEHTDFYSTLSDIQENLESKIMPLFLPLGKETGFKGIIDIITQKAYQYKEGKREEIKLPDTEKENINDFRPKIVETIVEENDELLEKYLEGEEIEEKKLLETLTQAIGSLKIIPVFPTSALKGIGTDVILSCVVNYLPQKDKIEKPSALVFKTYNDPLTGKISCMKVCSGVLNSDNVYFNVNKNTAERIGTLMKLQGKNTTSVESAEQGEIIACSKLKATQTGDTLAEKGSSIKYDFIDMPVPQISYAIYAKAKGDEEKIGTAISKIVESDPSLVFEKNVETQEFLLKGLGKMHLETTASKLKNKFGVDVKLTMPKVAYRETIKGKTQSHGRYKKQTGGHGQFGDCRIELEPLPRGSGFEFVNKIVGGAIPRQFIPSVEKGIKNTIEKGILANYPLTDIKITLYDGMYHPVDSSDIAFQMAGSIAFKEGVKDCNPVLLEPIMEMEIFAPDENTGDIVGDLNSRRGKVIGMNPKGGGYNCIKAIVPHAEVLDYAPTLRAITQGNGYFTMKFNAYEEVPPQLSQKIIEKRKEENK